MKTLMIVLAVMSASTVAHADEYLSWKKEGIDLKTDAGCKKMLQWIAYETKKVGAITAVKNAYPMARSIRGKSEGCTEAKLGVSQLNGSWEGRSNDLVSGYEHLRNAGKILGVDVSSYAPKM